MQLHPHFLSLLLWLMPVSVLAETTAVQDTTEQTTEALATESALECVEPDDRISIPDGATASNEAMMQARDAVSEYSEQAQLFLQCLDAQEREMEGVSEQRKSLIAKYNQVVSRIKELAANFNDQLELYEQQPGNQPDSEPAS